MRDRRPARAPAARTSLPISAARGLLRQRAIGVVDEGDAAVGVAQHDQVALRFEQAAGALLGFLQFPIAVGQRFIVQRQLCACAAAHPAQPHAQHRQRDAGQREQEAGADREGVRIVAGVSGRLPRDEADRRRRTRPQSSTRRDAQSSRARGKRCVALINVAVTSTPSSSAVRLTARQRPLGRAIGASMRGRGCKEFEAARPVGARCEQG